MKATFSSIATADLPDCNHHQGKNWAWLICADSTLKQCYLCSAIRPTDCNHHLVDTVREPRYFECEHCHALKRKETEDL